MPKKKYHGFVVGKKAIDNGYIYLVSTERRSDFIGDYVDVVFSKTEYYVADEIEYYFRKQGEEYKAYA